MERDIQLDLFRGLAIIWVLFVHCVYWVGLLTSPYSMIIKSFLLFEMPLLFLITGASNSLSIKPFEWRSYFIRRISRIVVPYWIYALICVILIQTTITYLQVPGNVPYFSWFITFGVKSDLWSNIPYLTWHLWFIPVYLIIIVIIPFLKTSYKKLKGKNKVIPLILFTLIVALFDIYNFGEGNLYLLYYYIKNIIFYSFWIYLGLFYSEFKNKNLSKRLLLIISIISYVVLYLLTFNIYSIDMQLNKFPPNLAFFFLSIGNISLLFLIKDYVFEISSRLHLYNLISRVGKYSYTVYLYQPFAFIIGGIILHLFSISLYNQDIVGVTYYFVINLICALLFIKIFGAIENLKLNTFINIKNL